MQIVKDDTNGVIADSLDIRDADMTSPGDQNFLTRPMTLDFRRRAFDTQILGRQGKRRAVVKDNFE